MLDERLIEAYRATDYVLLDPDLGPGGEIVLNIGRPNPEFDRVLERRGAATAVVVTAYNPRSVVLPDAENRARHRRLVALLQRRGYDHALGEGRDPTGHWTAEVECVVFGIGKAAGLDLARAFDQNAIVFVEKGGAPELCYPD
ncbi:MAG TPA: DUF3293 domain-containing protein [Candidatus Cybelea sp.]|nr:DUF3293 domain-containing protein [Candidatus Cybelea sp.]